MKSATQLVLRSQLALLVSILVCVVLAPEVVFTSPQGGVSNYGTMATTWVVFSIGTWACALLLLRAAGYERLQQLRLVIRALAFGYVSLALSTYPYKINTLFENLHIFVAFGLVIFQQCLAVWLAVLNRFDRNSKVGLGLQLLSLGIGLLTLFEIASLLFTAQIVGAIGFGILLVHSVRTHEAVTVGKIAKRQRK